MRRNTTNSDKITFPRDAKICTRDHFYREIPYRLRLQDGAGWVEKRGKHVFCRRKWSSKLEAHFPQYFDASGPDSMIKMHNNDVPQKGPQIVKIRIRPIFYTAKHVEIALCVRFVSTKWPAQALTGLHLKRICRAWNMHPEEISRGKNMHPRLILA